MNPSYSEIYMQNFPPSENLVFKAKQQTSQFQHQQFKEWSQVFDLQDSVLICQIEGNELDMRLIHFTDQPLLDYLTMIEKGIIMLPTQISIRSFIKTKEEQKVQLKMLFNQYNSAKIIVDGQIAPNIQIDAVYHQNQFNNNFGFGSIVPMGENSAQYRITFATTSNLLYQIDFERFFLKDRETIFVQQPKDLSSLIYGFVKTVDKSKDIHSQANVYYIGTALTFGHQETLPQGSSEETVFALKEDQLVEFKSQQFTMTKMIPGLIKTVRKSIKEKLQSHNPIAYFTQKKTQDTTQQRLSKVIIGEEGVVTVKALQNGVFAVVYTSGIFRVWALHSGQCLAEQDLLENAIDESEDIPEKTKQAKVKITQCKIAFTTSKARYEELNKFTKTMKIAVAFAQQKQTTLQVRWVLDQFQLKFSDIPPDYDSEKEALIDLGSREIEFDQLVSQKMDEFVEISDINFEQNEISTSLWLATHDAKNKQTQIRDLYADTSNIWDKGLQIEYHALLDHINLSQHLQDSPFSAYAPFIKEHLFQRITARNRFSKVAILQQLQDSQELRDSSQPLINQIQDIQLQGEVVQLKKLLRGTIMVENGNTRITGMSQQLQFFPFRLVVRPLGVSVIKENSQISSMQVTPNMICIGLSKIQQDMTFQNIRQIIQRDDAFSLLPNLIGGLKFMLLSNLAQVDSEIQENPSQVIQILHGALRESYEYESLHIELLSIIEQHRNPIEQQMNQFVESIVVRLLQGNAQTGRYMQYPDLTITSPIEFNDILMKVIENGLLEEISNLYESLRDFMLFSMYVKIHRPFIGSTNEQIQQEAYKQDMLLSWLKQIVSLKTVLFKEFDIETLQQKSLTIKKQTSIAMVQQLNTLDEFDRGTMLSYLLASDSKLYHPSSISNPHIRKNHLFFEDLLTRLIQNFTFQTPLESSSLYVPVIVKKLVSLGSWEQTLKYLTTIDTKTVALDFIRALAVANIGESPADFLDHMNDCILQFDLHSDTELLTDCSQLILKKRKVENVIKSIKGVTNSQKVEFFLVILQELKSLDERYSIFVLTQALLLIQNLTNKEKDYLNQQLFNISKVSSSLDYMYLACTKINAQNLRKTLIGSFFERLSTENNHNLLTTKCFFSQEDISLAIDYFFDQIDAQFETQKQQQQQNRYSLKWRKDVETLLKILHLIAQLYHRHQEVCRFKWQLHQKLQDLVQKEVDIITNTNLENIMQLLELGTFTVELIYLNALKLKDNVFITEIVDKTLPKNKKRHINEIANEEDQQVLVADTTDAISSKGYQILKEEQKETKFIQGTLKTIEMSDIRRAILLSQGRTQVLEYTTSADPLLIVKVLSETKYFDLAIELALSCKQGVAYALSSQIASYNLEKEQNDVEDDGQEFTSAFTWNQRQFMRTFTSSGGQQFQNEERRITQYIDQLLNQYLPRLETQDLIDLARNLISMEVELPIQLEHALKEHKQLQALVEFYLTQNGFDFKKAFEIVWKYLPDSVQNLAEANINILAFLLKTLDEALAENQKHLRVLNDEIKQLQLGGRQIPKRFMSLSASAEDRRQQQSFRSDIEQFYIELGMQGDGIMERINAQEEDSLIEKDSQEMVELKSEIAEVERVITTLRQGVPQIKKAAVDFLNSPPAHNQIRRYFLDGPVDMDLFYGIKKVSNQSVMETSNIVKVSEPEDQEIEEMEIEEQHQTTKSPQLKVSHSISNSTLIHAHHQSQSLNLSTFDRLYYSGIQRKFSKERQRILKKEEELEMEVSHCQPGPRISLISAEVARSMNQRAKTANFLEFSQEWQKTKESRLQQAKFLQETRIIEETKPVHKINQKLLPRDYKGPVSGYYDRVNRFFEKKKMNMEMSVKKLNATPSINRKGKENSSMNDEVAVEERLIKKGQEYKVNVTQKRHVMMQEFIKEGPLFKPKLVSNSEQYLHGRRAETNDINNQIGIGSHLYYEAMVFLMNKHTKIIETQRIESMNPRIPFVNSISEKIVSQIQRKPLYDPTAKKIVEEPVKQVIDEEKKREVKEKVQGFIKRNYEKEVKMKAKKNSEAAKDIHMEKRLLEMGSTFKPQLSEKSEEIMSQRKKTQPTFEQLYKEAKTKMQRKQVRMEKHQKEQQEKELEGVTFKPDVKKTIKTSESKSSSLTSKNSKVSTYIPPQKQKQQKNSYLDMHYKQQQKTPIQQQQLQQVKRSPIKNETPFIVIRDEEDDEEEEEEDGDRLEAQQQTMMKQSQEIINIRNSTDRKRSSSVLSRESNLLDFNEDKFFDDTKSLVYNNPTQRSSRSSSINYKKETNAAHVSQFSRTQPGNDVITDFIHEMSNSLSQPLDKVIQEAKKAIQEYDDNQESEGDTESDKFQNQEIENQIIPNSLSVEVTDFAKKQSPKFLESPQKKAITPKSERKSEQKSMNQEIESEVRYQDEQEEEEEHYQGTQPISSLMNKTLSLIEEEMEEDFGTNEEQNEHYQNGHQEKVNGRDIENEHKQSYTVGIVRDIEIMEKEFTRFLEMIYN